jgi:D-2-hydroxyacid dehydrogenase (NADP+)
MIPEFVSKQAEHTWGPRTAVTADLTDWTGQTLTVYGLGSIGETIAERGSAFGMDVYGVKRDPEDYDGCLPAGRVLASDEFHDVLPETDLLVAIAPLTEETRGSIDGAVFRALPDSAILINVSRGPVVDEAALVDALRAGELAGAGLDVFEAEPLPADSPLWDREDVIVTPHVGGRSNSFPTRFADLFAENYGRWRADEPLQNQIA